MLVTSQGIIMRTAIDEIPVLGRATQGVIVTRLPQDSKVISVAMVEKEEEEAEGEEETNNAEANE